MGYQCGRLHAGRFSARIARALWTGPSAIVISSNNGSLSARGARIRKQHGSGSPTSEMGPSCDSTALNRGQRISSPAVTISGLVNLVLWLLSGGSLWVSDGAGNKVASFGEDQLAASGFWLPRRHRRQGRIPDQSLGNRLRPVGICGSETSAIKPLSLHSGARRGRNDRSERRALFEAGSLKSQRDWRSTPTEACLSWGNWLAREISKSRSARRDTQPRAFISTSQDILFSSVAFWPTPNLAAQLKLRQQHGGRTLRPHKQAVTKNRGLQ